MEEFRFKGISNLDMKVIPEELEFLSKAPQNYERIPIEGRNGAIFNELGYMEVQVPIRLQILDKNKLDEIFEWLNGEGEFEFKNKVTKAYFYNEIDLKRLANIKTADFFFIRQPFWYKKYDDYIIINHNVINEGTVYSEPIIRLEKGLINKVDITIAGIRFIYNFNEDTYVEIDCETLYVNMNGLSRNRQLEIGYEFPKLQVGSNKIIINSGDCIVKTKRKDRWL